MEGALEESVASDVLETSFAKDRSRLDLFTALKIYLIMHVKV